MDAVFAISPRFQVGPKRAMKTTLGSKLLYFDSEIVNIFFESGVLTDCCLTSICILYQRTKVKPVSVWTSSRTFIYRNIAYTYFRSHCTSYFVS